MFDTGTDAVHQVRMQVACHRSVILPFLISGTHIDVVDGFKPAVTAELGVNSFPGKRICHFLTTPPAFLLERWFYTLFEGIKRLPFFDSLNNSVMQIGKYVNLHGFGDRESGGVFFVPHVLIRKTNLEIFIFYIVQCGFWNYVCHKQFSDTACSIRWRAISKYSCFISEPMYFLPVLRQATPKLPEPMKGS